MELDLNTLEIRLLLKCNKGLLGRTDLTQIYQKHPAHERKAAITTLLEKGYLIVKKLPTPGARRTPEFYEITEQGKQWLHDYHANYPSKRIWRTKEQND